MKELFTIDMSDGAGDSSIESCNPASVVQVSSIPNQAVQVQSVIQSNQPSVIQTTGSLPAGIQTIQVVRVAAVDDEVNNEDLESKKRREILARRPSYRKILNDLSSPSTKMEDDDDDSSQDDDNLSSGGAVQLTQTPSGAIQIQSADGSASTQGLQTLTMTNTNQSASPPTGATIVQYAQGPDGQFYIPVGGGNVQAYQIAQSLPQGVVMATTGGGMSTQQQLSEEASRKRELRLLKNRDAAKECRRKKKEYVKCLENRVAVLENQNKTLIEELKALKELYCLKDS